MLTLTGHDLDQLTATAQASPRLRANRNFHPELTAPVQRLAIAMEPGTYVRPHRHMNSWELLSPLRGAFDLVLFDEAGVLTARHRLAADASRVIEMPAGTWHSVVSLATGSVIFEVKEGPYQPVAADSLAAWSPAEGEANVPAMLEFLAGAAVGAAFR